jgi:hypothetical protein
LSFLVLVVLATHTCRWLTSSITYWWRLSYFRSYLWLAAVKASNLWAFTSGNCTALEGFWFGHFCCKCRPCSRPTGLGVVERAGHHVAGSVGDRGVSAPHQLHVLCQVCVQDGSGGNLWCAGWDFDLHSGSECSCCRGRQ